MDVNQGSLTVAGPESTVVEHRTADGSGHAGVLRGFGTVDLETRAFLESCGHRRRAL